MFGVRQPDHVKLDVDGIEEKMDGRWELVRSWPYDGYDDPHSPDLPD